MKRLISLAISLVLACQMALPVFAQAGTETQTTTESGSTQQQTEASTGTETSTGTDTSAPTEGQEATGEQTTGSTEVTALPTITSQSYIVMNADTGQVLISRYPDNKQYPGDITKVLTTALALEYVDPESTYTITTEDVFPTYPESYRFSNGTYVAITQDEVVNIRDLLYATTIQSADDTANALADCAAKLANRSVTLEDGSTSYTAGFVEMMNEKVQDLGCVNTNFVNPHGLYNDNHYTTAYDMYLITKYALQFDLFREIVSTLAQKHLGLEINTAGLRREIGQTSPTLEYVKLFRELGGEILTFGSDAHCAQDLGAGLETAIDMAKEAGFSYFAFYKKHEPRMLRLL